MSRGYLIRHNAEGTRRDPRVIENQTGSCGVHGKASWSIEEKSVELELSVGGTVVVFIVTLTAGLLYDAIQGVLSIPFQKSNVCNISVTTSTNALMREPTAMKNVIRKVGDLSRLRYSRLNMCFGNPWYRAATESSSTP